MSIQEPGAPINRSIANEQPVMRRIHNSIPPALASKLGRPSSLEKTVIDGLKGAQVPIAVGTQKGMNKAIAASLGAYAAACSLEAAFAALGLKK